MDSNLDMESAYRCFEAIAQRELSVYADSARKSLNENRHKKRAAKQWTLKTTMAVSAPAVMTTFLSSSTAAPAAMCQTGGKDLTNRMSHTR
jgi:hypothetical protein